MTKLTYIVGDKEITTYSKALEESARTGAKVVRHYEPIITESEVDPVMRAKRAAILYARAHQQ